VKTLKTFFIQKGKKLTNTRTHLLICVHRNSNIMQFIPPPVVDGTVVPVVDVSGKEPRRFIKMQEFYKLKSKILS
jgi:hypothetical protein